LYNEIIGEKGNYKEKDDNDFRCSDVVREGQCTQADIESFDCKCWWNSEMNEFGVCLSLEDEYTSGRLFPFVCDNYEITLSLLIVTDGPCFHNHDKSTSDLEKKCISVTEIIKCEDIRTNGLFEMEKHFCDDAKDIFSWIKGAACIWMIEDDVGSSGKCVQVENCSDLIGIKNGSQCNDYSSLKGNCFFNGNVKVNNTEVKCFDVVDVVRCGDILEMGLCVHAKKDTYPNLTIDSLSSPSTIYCTWEGGNETCVSKNTFSLFVYGVIYLSFSHRLSHPYRRYLFSL
jgi:hypothetical protein